MLDLMITLQKGLKALDKPLKRRNKMWNMKEKTIKMFETNNWMGR